LPQTIVVNETATDLKNSPKSTFPNGDNTVLPKTQFQIEREAGISVEQLKVNLLSRVRQLWKK
jgi:hypothetical protein